MKLDIVGLQKSMMKEYNASNRSECGIYLINYSKAFMSEFDADKLSNLQARYISRLMLHLLMHDDFSTKLNELRIKYIKQIERLPWQEIKDITDKDKSFRQNEKNRKQVKRYRDAILSTVSKYGLNPDWAMEIIHNAVLDENYIALGSDLMIREQRPLEVYLYLEDYDQEDDYIPVEWIEGKYYDTTIGKFRSAREIRKHLHKELDKQWPRIKEQ